VADYAAAEGVQVGGAAAVKLGRCGDRVAVELVGDEGLRELVPVHGVQRVAQKVGGEARRLADALDGRELSTSSRSSSASSDRNPRPRPTV
jgi:hypothetical protein